MIVGGVVPGICRVLSGMTGAGVSVMHRTVAPIRNTVVLSRVGQIGWIRTDREAGERP
jgi:hypothetical protein